MERFVPIKRTAIDGKVWWVVWDNKANNYSSFTCHRKYETKKTNNENRHIKHPSPSQS